MCKPRRLLLLWLLVLALASSLSGMGHGLLHEHGSDPADEDLCVLCLPSGWSVEVDACAPQTSWELEVLGSESPAALLLEPQEDDSARRGRAPPRAG